MQWLTLPFAPLHDEKVVGSIPHGDVHDGLIGYSKEQLPLIFSVFSSLGGDWKFLLLSFILNFSYSVHQNAD